MSIFKRVLRWVFLLFGVIAGISASIIVYFSRRLINPPRQPQWANPSDLGLSYESVQFPAADGVRLSGWFVPAKTDTGRGGATLILVHGWPWNRLGEAAEDFLSGILQLPPVDLLRLAFSLQQDGYNLLMFDLRNHGSSAAAPPVTFGWQESKDLLGAVQYLNSRDDVDSGRIGAVGFSMGANTVLYGLSKTDQIKAAIAVQPTSIGSFSKRYAADLVGPLAKVVLPITELIYRAAGGPPMGSIQPGFAAAGTGNTPVLYIQSQTDRWGSLEDVTQMSLASPAGHGPLAVEADDRFGGYQYLIDHPVVATAFFEQHL